MNAELDMQGRDDPWVQELRHKNRINTHRAQFHVWLQTPSGPFV